MYDLVGNLNVILNCWKQEYDVLSKVVLQAGVNEDGILVLNDSVLCPAADLVLAHAEFQNDQICCQFVDSRELIISIAWPEEGIPYVRSIYMGPQEPPEDDE